MNTHSFVHSGLKRLGFNEFFENQITTAELERHRIARVVEECRGSYVVSESPGQELIAAISGKLRYRTETLPSVGDWVLIAPHSGGTRAIIHRVLERKSTICRKAAGTETREQIIGANIDILFIASSLNADFNPSRLQRYLALACGSGAQPVVLLTKRDLCADPFTILTKARRLAEGASVHSISSVTGEGFEELVPYLSPGSTCALIGSSGVGKSSVINRLLGFEAQAVSEIRSSDERGRHATTSRQLLALPTGALIIDTPGMRELMLWESEDEDLSSAFAGLSELAASCRFNDCGHSSEPGCAVQAAIESGEIERTELENFLKLKREQDYLNRKIDARAMSEDRKKWKKLGKQGRERAEFKRRGTY